MSTTGKVKSSSQSSHQKHSVKVLAILGARTACEYVRIILPYEYLRAHGIQADWVWKDDIQKMLPRLREYDMFVFPRHVPRDGHNDVYDNLFAIERARGKKIIYETDDDPYDHRFTTNTEGVQHLIGQCDAVTASTRPLADRVEHHNTHVFENHISAALWDMHQRVPAQEIVIGISGSATHFRDWQVAREALYKLARKHSHVQFVTFGYKPDYLSDLPRLAEIPPVPYTAYPGELKKFDIGLAPLVSDDPFNLYKSPLKAIDYAAAGVAAVVSDHPVYRQVEGVKRVKDDGWFDVLDELVSDSNALNALKRRGEKWVRKHRTLEQRWRDLADTYQRIGAA